MAKKEKKAKKRRSEDFQEEMTAETLPEQDNAEAEAADAEAPFVDDSAALAAEVAALRAQQEVMRREALAAKAAALLTQMGLPGELAECCVPGQVDSEEALEERVQALAHRFREAVTVAVARRLRGRGAPKAPMKVPAYSREELKGMSAGEINAHWEEVVRALRE